MEMFKYLGILCAYSLDMNLDKNLEHYYCKKKLPDNWNYSCEFG